MSIFFEQVDLLKEVERPLHLLADSAEPDQLGFNKKFSLLMIEG